MIDDTTRLPYGMSVKFHDYCDNCMEAEICSATTILMADDNSIDAHTEIYCKHYEKCEKMYERLKELTNDC